MPAATLEPAPAAASAPCDPDEMLTALYADHGSALRRFVARLGGDRSRVEDIIQETMLRAWRHPEWVTGCTGAPRAWLYTVARHLAIDQHRSRQARPAEPAGGKPARPKRVSMPLPKGGISVAVTGEVASLDALINVLSEALELARTAHRQALSLSTAQRAWGDRARAGTPAKRGSRPAPTPRREVR